MIDTGAPNIFLAASYRTGSTHISYGLCYLTGFRRATTVNSHGEGEEEQIINENSALILFPYGRQVFQQHTKGSGRHSVILSRFKVKTVVLLRNVYDQLVSLEEWMSRKNTAVIPGLVKPANWYEMDTQQHYVWLVYNAVPWLLSFYVSWERADTDRMFFSYEKFFSDQQAGFRKILDWYGLKHDEAVLDIVTESKQWSFNKGESGRSEGLFPVELRPSVEAQAKAWGDEMYRKIKQDIL